MLDKKLYEKYLLGEISFSKMAAELKMTNYGLQRFFYKNNIKYRKTVLDENTNHNFFDIIDSEIKAYLLGFYYADGSINKNGQLSISLTKEDIDIIKLFKENICKYNKITIIKEQFNKKTGYTSKPMCGITFKSPVICRKLEEYGMGRNKTKKDFYCIDFIPENLMIHFIRGYFDGDGTICVSKCKRKHVLKNGEEKTYMFFNYNWSIISNTSNHLIFIKDFLEKKYNIHSNIISDKRGHYLIEINRKKDFFKMKDILYKNANFFLKRKYEKYMAIPC